jgi:prepilin-type N-terminal cleavage/methylation domain-containing protein
MFEKMVKMRNKKGFTLMELLIVVAIIAILVAISIPVFTSQLEKAREADRYCQHEIGESLWLLLHILLKILLLTVLNRQCELMYRVLRCSERKTGKNRDSNCRLW